MSGLRISMKLRNELTEHHFTNILNSETICNCNTIFLKKKSFANFLKSKSIKIIWVNFKLKLFNLLKFESISEYLSLLFKNRASIWLPFCFIIVLACNSIKPRENIAYKRSCFSFVPFHWSIFSNTFSP